MLSINLKSDLSIKTKNMTPQFQCLNERRSNFTAVIIWPDIVGQEYPILQWLDWPLAEQNLKVWVEELFADKSVGFARRLKPAVFDCEKRDQMFEHLQVNLGWGGVANRAHSRHYTQPQEIYKIYYEEQHDGKLN